MANLNRVLLIGRLTRDPELRYTPSGTAVSDLGLAVNRNYTGQDGTRKEETCFLDIVVWGKQAENCHKFLAKGRQIFVEGRLKMDSWENKDGQRRNKIQVVADTIQFLGGPSSKSNDPDSDGYSGPNVSEEEDEIPF